MASTRIAELSSLIATHTANVDAYLAAIGSSSPSFEPGQASNTLSDEPIAVSRQIILDATDELHALMLGPAESASFAEIADGTSLNESMVRRIIRHAASYRIFREPRKGFVEHTGASKFLAENHDMRQWIGMDRAEVVEVGRASLPTTVEDHVSFMEHDFFKEQPTKAAAVYILRWILHDWSDTYAIKILRVLTPALVENSKILICESVLPDPGSVSTLRDRTARSMDLSMLEFHNGKERDHDDWVELLHVADPRYQVISIRQPPLSRLALLEVGWRGDAATLA
ncbi:MAG: hypothetical protein Q9191_000594 [Dirinaria sp. TL-2023a]